MKMLDKLEAIVIEEVNPKEFRALKHFMQDRKIGNFTTVYHNSDPINAYLHDENIKYKLSLKLAYDQEHKRIKFFSIERGNVIPLERSQVYYDFFQMDVKETVELLKKHLSNIREAEGYSF